MMLLVPLLLYISEFMPNKYLCEGNKSKTNQYSNKTYMCGLNEITLAIAIPRITVVKTVEIREICKRKCKDTISCFIEQCVCRVNI